MPSGLLLSSENAFLLPLRFLFFPFPNIGHAGGWAGTGNKSKMKKIKKIKKI